MAKPSQHALSYIQELLTRYTPDSAAELLSPKFEPAFTRVPGGTKVDAATVERRWAFIDCPTAREQLLDPATASSSETYRQNIENFIGSVKLPVGIAGPLRVNGLSAQGDYLLPLATTEAALVASFHRGACLISSAGGCSALILAEGVQRSPGFLFRTLEETGRFLLWCIPQIETLRTIAETTTQHGKLNDIRFTVEGNHVYLILEFTTADASGQNMVTIATQEVCNYICANTPVQPQMVFVEANYSGDKKASAMSFQSVRGRKVTAEVHIPAALIEKWLHTTPQRMVSYWQMSALGGVMSGTIGVQGHYANGLAALFLACGQDIACVAEAAVGVTRFELKEDGGLYASVTLPNLILGTVGGGTGLPSQQACLSIMKLAGAGKSRALSEVCAGMVLAGELSIIGALSAGDFTSAHHRLARGRNTGIVNPF